MRNKLKISAIFLALLLLITPLSVYTADATSFERSISSFGLYSDNENAILRGNVKYVIDENGKAVQYSEYSVNSGVYYVPFVSSTFNIPEIDIECELCFGEPISFNNDYNYAFYPSDLNGMTGTVYTLNATSESFTVNFTMPENQSCIFKFTQGSTVIRDGKHIDCTIIGAQTDTAYEVFILNGDCTELESTAAITKETVTVKEYIDRNFSEFKDYLSVSGEFAPKPDILYALANRATANNINYDYFDFFIDSFATMRLNAYKMEVETPCTISYSMAVDVQKNGSFTPEIYKTDQTATGNYAVDYTVELDGKFPYIIESSADVKKQGEYIYTARNVTDDFYFVFSSTKKPESVNGNTENRALNIVLYVVLGVAVFSLTVIVIILILYKKSRTR